MVLGINDCSNSIVKLCTIYL